ALRQRDALVGAVATARGRLTRRRGGGLDGRARSWVEPVLGAEIHARGRLDPVCAVAEVDRVQVLGEDLRLVPLPSQVVGERGLSELLEHGPVALFGKGVLDELLRDRRGALARPARDVGDKGSADPSDVDAGI